LLARRLRGWAAFDVWDVLVRLSGASGEDHITLWKFVRELTCTLVYGRFDCQLIVDTERRRHFSKRFTHEGAAVNYAEMLREKVRVTRWMEVDVPRKKLRGER
jgi:hypothetical protein